MQMDYTKEEIILDDDEVKDYDVIYEQEVECVGMELSRRESRDVEIIEPQWDNDK